MCKELRLRGSRTWTSCPKSGRLRLPAPPALLGGSRASLPRHAGYSWLGLRLRPGWSRTQAHVCGLKAAHAVGPEQLHGADELAGGDVDRPLDPALPTGHQPIQVGRPTRQALAPRATAATTSAPLCTPPSTR